MDLTKTPPPQQPEDVSISWHALPAEDVLQTLRSPQDIGLSNDEVARRLGQYGKNELEEAPRPTFLKLVFDQLNSFVIWLLICGGGHFGPAG